MDLYLEIPTIESHNYKIVKGFESLNKLKSIKKIQCTLLNCLSCYHLIKTGVYIEVNNWNLRMSNDSIKFAQYLHTKDIFFKEKTSL